MTKKIKLAFIAILLLAVAGVIGQQVKENKSSSNGNAEMMRQNLNEPNNYNPATHNDQKYDHGDMKVKSEHPKDNLGNNYTNAKYSEKKPEASK